MSHWCRRPLALAVGLMTVTALSLGPVTAVPGQSQEVGIHSILPPEVRGALSGVTSFGAPTAAQAGVGVTAPIVFGADVLVSGVNTSPQNEPEVATQKWQNTILHAAGANDYGTGSGDSRCGAYFSTNGGISWARAQGGSGQLPLPPALVTLFGTNRPVAGDPDLAWSNTLIPISSTSGFPGLYYSCLAFFRAGSSASHGSVYVARSTNGGSTYTALDSGIVATGSPSVFHDKPFIAADTNTRSPFMGSVYVCWTRFDSTGADILFRRSTTQATSWLPAAPGLVLSDTAATSQGCDVAVGPNGDVYVTWLEFTTNLCEGTIRIKRSTNGGATFGVQVTVAAVSGPAAGCSLPSRAGLGSYRINNFPRIATDRLLHVGVVFSSDLCYTVAGGVVLCSVGLDVWFWRASQALGGPIIRKVNDDVTAADQHWPAVATSDRPTAVTGHGNWFVCYIDRSFAATAGDWDTACTHSHTDASTWPEPVQLVSDISSFDGQFGGLFIGDYHGVVTSGLGALAPGHVHPVYPRNSAAGSGEMNIFGANAAPTAPLAPATEGD